MANVLDRLIGYVSPERGAARARARNAIRIYEGADRGRRGSSWSARGTSANTELQSAIGPLRDRSRDLARNNPWAARMLDVMCSHVVGNGIIPVSASGSDKIDNRVNNLWNDWIEECDVTGGLHFYALQDLAVRSMIEGGETVTRFIDRELVKNTAVPLRLQLLESDFIDSSREGQFATARDLDGAPGVKRNRLGVGLGEYDAMRGLWLWPYHPGEMNTFTGLDSYTSNFVQRADLAHMFRRERPGQVRGVPWFAPILMTARDLSDMLDAANVKARVEACFAGFITNSDDSAPLMDDNGITSTPQQFVTSLEPGMLKELRSGQDIKFAAPTSTSQLDTILINNLQAMAAGVGCTYDQATGDLRQANYSSLRAGKIEFWRLIGRAQQHIIIPQFCKPVWQRFIDRAVLAGRLPSRPGGYPVRWVVPAKEMIDPKKDFDATKNLVRSGAMTPQDFIASFGGDWRKSLTEYKKFFEMANDKGVILDIDVAHVDQHGRQPTKAGGDQPLEEGDASLDDADDRDDDRDSDKDE